MGYNTNYDLSVINAEHPQYVLFETWITNKPETLSGYKLLPFFLGKADSCKWYEWNEDMLAVSKMFPDLVFCLHGEGEENGDAWYAYFKNGKVQLCRAIIKFDEYDEAKLK
jgi:hypothetical protein